MNEKVASRLILVGDGPERYSIEKLCRAYNLCDRVTFLGKVRDTSHVLEIADLFILPSETESFGLAALEAMAVGVPVISSNAGGIPEVNTVTSNTYNTASKALGVVGPWSGSSQSGLYAELYRDWETDRKSVV